MLRWRCGGNHGSSEDAAAACRLRYSDEKTVSEPIRMNRYATGISSMSQSTASKGHILGGGRGGAGVGQLRVCLCVCGCVRARGRGLRRPECCGCRAKGATVRNVWL